MRCIHSKKEERIIKFFDKWNNGTIKSTIKEWLENNPTDVVELCKAYSNNNPKRFLGYQIVGTYMVNPKTNKPSLKYFIGNKLCFKDLI
jgi:hypothetical protein